MIAVTSLIPPKRVHAGKSIPVLVLMVVMICLIAEISHCADQNIQEADHQLSRNLHFGVLNTLYNVNIDDARVALEMNLNRQAGFDASEIKITIGILSDRASVVEQIQQKRLHGLSTTGIDYLLLRDVTMVRPFFIASAIENSPMESYVLLTRKGINLAQLAGMQRRRLMIENNSPVAIGRIWLETVLHEFELPEGEDLFTSIKAAKKPTRMVLPVFFGQAEASLVPESVFNTMVELNPQIGKKIQVILRSPGFIKNLVCIADYLDPKLIGEMAKRMSNMHKGDDGRQFMMILRHRRYFPFKPEYFYETERILQKYQKLNPGLGRDYQRVDS